MYTIRPLVFDYSEDRGVLASQGVYGHYIAQYKNGIWHCQFVDTSTEFKYETDKLYTGVSVEEVVEACNAHLRHSLEERFLDVYKP